MYRSKRYEEWRAMVLPLFLAAWNRPVDATSEFALYLDIALSRRQRDVHNYAEAILDTLQGVCYADDKQVTVLHIRRIASDARRPLVHLLLCQAAGEGT